MRRIIMLSAMLAALGTAPPVEAGERGFGVRHFSPQAAAKFHRPHHRFDLHRRDLFGKHRHVRPRHFAQPRFVLEFRSGDFAFRFGDVPRFEPRHLHHRHGRVGVISRFGPPWRLEALGFREVPKLLQERGHWARLSTRQPPAGR